MTRVVAAMVLLMPLFLGACSKQVKLEWNCQGTTKNSMQCHISNTGQAAGSVCFDVVQVCQNGEHAAHVCSETIEPGNTEDKVITAFTPPVGWLETCMGTEVRNKHITPAN